MAGFVSEFSGIFSNFEKTFANVNFVKVELQHRDSKMIEDYYTCERSFRGGVQNEFVRIYQEGTPKIRLNRSIGFTFYSGEEKAEDGVLVVFKPTITISTHNLNIRKYQTYDVDQFKLKMKEFYKKNPSFESYDSFFNTFELFFISETSETKIVNEFNEEVKWKVRDATVFERDKYIASVSDLQVKNKKLRQINENIQKELDIVLEQLRNKHGYYSALDQYENAEKTVEDAGKNFVDKVKSQYDNYNITIQKFIYSMSDFFRYGAFQGQGFSNLLDKEISKK